MSGSSSPFTFTENIAVIELNSAPVNSLGYTTRRYLADGIIDALGNDAVQAIVLIGAHGAFSGGADIREIGTDLLRRAPTLGDLIRVIESSNKPVIAAIGGVAFGGGLELALSCHFRVIDATAHIALPEVKLGLLPGAGGTQRLPRLMGVEKSLNMVVSGASLAADAIRDTPLVDAFAEDGLLPVAVQFAQRVIDEKRPLRLARDIRIDFPNAAGFFQFARSAVQTRSGRFPAPVMCVDAIAAAVALPFEEGLEFEREAFLKLSHSAVSAAQRYIFLAEKAAAKIPDVPSDTPVRKIGTVAVIGAGTMGSGICMNFLEAGIPACILDTQQTSLDACVDRVRKQYEREVSKGRIGSVDLECRMDLLSTTVNYADIAHADLVVEAVFEDMGVKESVFRTLDEVMKPGAILASNTSTLDLNRIAAASGRPRDVVGMHFFSPAQVMRLLEVVRGDDTGIDVLATVMALAKRIRKTAVVSGVCDGFIGNRIVGQYTRVAGLLIDEGATPQQIDRALEDWGMAMGPFRVHDMAGLDVIWAIRKRHYIEKPHVIYSRMTDRLCEAGRFGQKTGKGWYQYSSGSRQAIPDPAVDALITQHRSSLGIRPRIISDREIVERCIFAIVNEAARLIEEKIVQRASDIDVVCLAGYAFPSHHGGPIHFANEAGLYNVLRAVEGFHKITADPFWEPAPLLVELAGGGKKFS